MVTLYKHFACLYTAKTSKPLGNVVGLFTFVVVMIEVGLFTIMKTYKQYLIKKVILVGKMWILVLF